MPGTDSRWLLTMFSGNKCSLLQHIESSLVAVTENLVFRPGICLNSFGDIVDLSVTTIIVFYPSVYKYAII